ncbi:glutaredoxin 3 [Solimonas sp. SE-A11]|uniref:glutaredoxin 3 n=1 Tax=Solimonas sp. SE-A11 TaxID=3054954 RepID=UPI00259CD0C3|nr:glutaredoxin 3 [Solimonas sp. SE-A11]MDM4768615.1 glutaredoxin 3 [Solimonas sp. SE-A11]
MKPVRMYTTRVCPFCVMAKRLLSSKGVTYEEIRVDENPGVREEMMRISGRRTVPQIFVGETHVGGFDDLSALDHAGKLDPLLKDSNS